MATFKMAVPAGFPHTFVAKDGSTYSTVNGYLVATRIS